MVLNPYLFGSLDAWWSDLRDQAEVAADEPEAGPGVGRRLATTSTASPGASAGRRRSPPWPAPCSSCAAISVRGLMLVAVPLALFVYLSVQSRYFGRWLLPAYPALAMLGALALARVAS